MRRFNGKSSSRNDLNGYLYSVRITNNGIGASRIQNSSSQPPPARVTI